VLQRWFLAAVGAGASRSEGRGRRGSSKPRVVAAWDKGGLAQAGKRVLERLDKCQAARGESSVFRAPPRQPRFPVELQLDSARLLGESLVRIFRCVIYHPNSDFCRINAACPEIICMHDVVA